MEGDESWRISNVMMAKGFLFTGLKGRVCHGEMQDRTESKEGETVLAKSNTECPEGALLNEFTSV